MKAAVTRFTGLDGLRGWAALVVVFYHALLYPLVDRLDSFLPLTLWKFHGYELLGRFLIALLNGETAVLLFFVISGAVLLRALDGDTHPLWVRLLAFPIKRVFRIYPALIVCLAAMYTVYSVLHAYFPNTYPPVSLSNTVINMSLADITVHGATWTLKVELLAIPFILAAFLLKKKMGVLGLLVCLAYSLVLFDIPEWGFRIFHLKSWLLYFCCGFLAYHLSHSLFIADLMSGYRWIAVLLGIVLFRPAVSMESNMGRLVQAFCMMTLVAYLLSEEKNRLTHFLSSRPSVFLGRISYSLYLWNVIFLNILLRPAEKLLHIKDNWIESGLIIGALATLLSIPPSVLSERWIEQPFIRACGGLLRLVPAMRGDAVRVSRRQG